MRECGKERSLKKGQWLKFLLCILFMGLYFLGMKKIFETVYPDCYYFDPGISPMITLSNCGIIALLFITINTKKVYWFFRHKIIFVSLLSGFLIILFLPVLFSKQGIIADDVSIQKKNLFGHTKSKYEYIDICNIDVSVKRGIQYEIKFDSGEQIWIFSYDAGIKNFRNDKNLLNFDQVISQYKKKTVTTDPTWITPNNTQRFIKDENVFQYFDSFFSQYYETKKTVKTGDSSVS